MYICSIRCVFVYTCAYISEYVYAIHIIWYVHSAPIIKDIFIQSLSQDNKTKERQKKKIEVTETHVDRCTHNEQKWRKREGEGEKKKEQHEILLNLPLE